MEKHKILFVDDEDSIRKSLRRIFHSEPYELLLAEDGYQGLELVQEHAPVVIVSDIRMPEMDGIEFLKKSAEIRPESVRIALSGYSDIGQIMDAINKDHVYRYITKPWDIDELKIIIRQSVEHYMLSREKEELIIKLNKRNDELAALSANLEKLVEERTKELQVKDKILHYLLTFKSLDESIGFILKSFFEVVAVNKIVFLKFDVNDKLKLTKGLARVGDKITDITDEILPLCATSIFKRFYPEMNLHFDDSPAQLKEELNKLNITDYIVKPVKNKNDDFGLLIFSFPDKKSHTSQMEEKIDSFTLYLVMLLADHSVIGNMDSLYQNIDRILKEV